MQAPIYSSDPRSKLNRARNTLWAAKYMLGAANQEPHRYSKSLWMGRINVYRAELRKIAHEMRDAQ